MKTGGHATPHIGQLKCWKVHSSSEGKSKYA